MRVTVITADGATVDLRIPGTYTPDVFQDLCNRVVELINGLDEVEVKP